MNEKVKSAHSEATAAAAQIQNGEVKLISALQVIDRERGYFCFEVTSLFDYCVKILKLSPATTQNYIAVCRKSVEVPELKNAIALGNITVCKARKIAPVINKANQEQWLELATVSTTREIEKAVAKEQPQLAVRETVKYVTENRLSLTLGFPEAELENLERVMDLESQRTKRASSREDAIIAALAVYIKHLDPVKKAERATERNQLAQKSSQPVVKSAQKLLQPAGRSTHLVAKRVPGHIGRRSALPAALVHAVYLRDQRRCTIKDRSNERCGATRWLDTHHIVPRSLGGGDTVENLTTVCSAHHRLIHRSE